MFNWTPVHFSACCCAAVGFKSDLNDLMHLLVTSVLLSVNYMQNLDLCSVQPMPMRSKAKLLISDRMEVGIILRCAYQASR